MPERVSLDNRAVRSRSAASASGLAREIGVVAQLAHDAAGAHATLVAYRLETSRDLVWLPADAPVTPLLKKTLIGLLSSKSAAPARELETALAAAIAADRSLGEVRADGGAPAFAHFRLPEVLAAVVGSRLLGREASAVARLLALSVAGLLERSAQSRKLQLWRERARLITEGAQSELANQRQELGEQTIIERAVSRVTEAPKRSRLATFCLTAARLGDCEGSLLLADRRGTLEVAASHHVRGRIPLDDASALVSSYTRQATISREAEGVEVYHEDRVLREDGYKAYLCLPLQSGAIALAARSTIDDRARRRVAIFVQRVDSSIRVWNLEDELAGQRILVQRLAIRVLSAADRERERLARELHDDQAQLLTAAQIALTSHRQAARKLFERLAAELRGRLRTLRCESLGTSSLRRALKLELERLEAAGLEVSFRAPKSLASIPRQLQQLCYQIVREALSNILRHANASRVKLGIESLPGELRLSISDDGGGMKIESAGSGLSGIEARVAVLGGTWQIASRDGKTTLEAVLPLLGL